jgi:hypothetical protein
VTAPRPTQPLRVRVLVADESEARFYNIAGPGEPLELRGQVSNPKAHLHDRDLKSDRRGASSIARRARAAAVQSRIMQRVGNVGRALKRRGASRAGSRASSRRHSSRIAAIGWC